jgi:hypothetical protein
MTAKTGRQVDPWRVDTAHPYDRLPFVTCPKDGTGRNFWAPRPTGDYNEDCCLGEQYAEAVIPMLRDDHNLLGLIVVSIMAHGDDARDRGVVVGFMLRISKRLIVGPARQLRAIRALAAEVPSDE